MLDVQPKLAAKVRLLDTGSTNKNDPNDARSIAIAALRAKGLPVVHREDHVEVMKIRARRRRELQRTNNRIANRLHAVLCELVPGGFAGPISPAKAERILDQVQPANAITAARFELAQEILEDLRRNNPANDESWSSGSPRSSPRQARPPPTSTVSGRWWRSWR